MTEIDEKIDLMRANEDVESVREILSEMGELQPPNPTPNIKPKHLWSS